MSLYSGLTSWKVLRRKRTFEAFWEEYSGTETRIYENILDKDAHLAGKFSESPRSRSSKQTLLFSWASSTASRQPEILSI